VDFEALQRAKLAVRELADSVGIDTDVVADDYPHFYYLPDETDEVNWTTLVIRGAEAPAFLHNALTRDVLSLQDGEQQVTWAIKPDGDRKSTRLNSSHVKISYAVFCLKKKKT